MRRGFVLLAVLTGCGSAEIAAEADETSATVEETGEQPSADSAAPSPTDSGATPEPDVAVDAPSDTPAPPPMDKKAVFLAQGHVGRTMLSCDDGRSWIKNRSDDDKVRCFEGGVDCDHMDSAGRGIAYGSGTFVATFGWGKPGSIRRSSDGFTWEKTLEGTTFGGMVFGDGVFVAASRSPRASMDFGKTWTKTAEPMATVWNVRGAGFAGGNVVMVLEDSGKSEVVLSSDAGKTWRAPTTWPSTCGKSLQSEGGIVFGKGTMLVVGGDGVACRSTDGGKTWKDARMGGQVSSFAHFTGTEFVAFGRTDKNVMYRSADGAAWTTTATSHAIGASARSDGGTYVATNPGWMVWYEKQQFYRSTDGVTWEALPRTAFTGSHPIRGMSFGYVDASACK